MPTTTIDNLSNDPHLQGHWTSRVVAGVIDAVITWIVAAIGCVPLIAFAHFVWFGWYMNLLIPFVWGLVFVVYSAVLESSRGATFGKGAMNLHVMAIDGAMTFDKALKRNISKIYWLALLIDLVIGFLTDGDPRQRYLDRVAGTTVVYTEPAAPVPYTPQPPPPPQYAPSQGAAPPAPPPAPAPTECETCGGRLIQSGDGRRQCIRCGKLYRAA